MDLAGVDPKDIELTVQPGRLSIRGYRSAPEPRSDKDLDHAFPLKTVRLLAMEIDYGPFERAIPVPADADLARIATDWENGILWIEIARLHQA